MFQKISASICIMLLFVCIGLFGFSVITEQVAYLGYSLISLAVATWLAITAVIFSKKN